MNESIKLTIVGVLCYHLHQKCRTRHSTFKSFKLTIIGIMEELKVKPIPTRKWKDKSVNVVFERDKDRKKSQDSVDKRIYYMWFNYLKLCLNLEEINYSVKKKGAKGKVLGETFVKVNRKMYKDWDLKDLYTMNFKKWYKGP